jgi:hypothetical protein
MDVRIQSKEGPIGSLPEQVTLVKAQIDKDQLTWRDQLRQDPSLFHDIEFAVHHSFQQLADQLVAGLLADAGQRPQLEDAAKKSS